MSDQYKKKCSTNAQANDLHVFVEAVVIKVFVSVDDELDEVVKDDSSTEIEKEIKLKGQDKLLQIFLVCHIWLPLLFFFQCNS